MVNGVGILLIVAQIAFYCEHFCRGLFLKPQRWQWPGAAREARRVPKIGALGRSGRLQGWASPSSGQIGEGQITVLRDELAQHGLLDKARISRRCGLPVNEQVFRIGKLPDIPATPVRAWLTKSKPHVLPEAMLKRYSLRCAASFADVDDLRLGKPSFTQFSNRDRRIPPLEVTTPAYPEEARLHLRVTDDNIDTGLRIYLIARLLKRTDRNATPQSEQWKSPQVLVVHDSDQDAQRI